MPDSGGIQRELVHAWRALTQDDHAGGLLLIPVAVGSIPGCRAGRLFPGNLEAVLVGFSTGAPLSPQALPEGAGFTVRSIDSPPLPRDLQWVAVAREPDGDLELFTLMSADALSALEADNDTDPYRRRARFLERIRAWQDFMSRCRGTVLTGEQQTGLFGELLMLETLGCSGYGWAAAVNAWQGPLNGLHDFVLPGGAIECKTTVVAGTFPVNVQSLAQLDPAGAANLYLAARRLQSPPDGLTLPTLVMSIRNACKGQGTCGAEFGNRLLRAGYLDRDDGAYGRVLAGQDLRILTVSDSFPALYRANVPTAVIAARYILDIDRIEDPGVDIDTCLKTIGAL